ncbi:MAG TPA: hypothetical protein VM733_15145 [Thermoanaerobaculia bacterium]|nr:hypothetical protein [Thermoanaerobaculia bacterium]
MRPSRRELVLSAAFAIYGLAIAIASLGIFERPAPPDQAMGLAKATNIDAHGPMRWVLALMLLPVVLPLVLRPVARMPLANWARNAILAASLATLWLTTVHLSVLKTIVPFAVVLALCVFIRKPMRFTRRDVVLVPVFLTTLIAFVDLFPKTSVFDLVPFAALLVFVVRIAVAFIPCAVPVGLDFLLAPLGLVLQTGFFARDERYFGWHALFLVVVTPFVMRLVLRNGRRAALVLTFVIYPLSLYAYWNAISRPTAEGKAQVNYFEAGHALLPASEYLRGERAYRDILPAHGLIEDGFLDYAVFETGEVTIGRALKCREVIGTLNAVALYFLAWAVIGSAEGALLAVLLSILMANFTPSIRMLPAVTTLALIAAAVRWRRPRWLAYAAAGTVVCGLTSLDFAAYTFAVLVIAVARRRTGFSPSRRTEVRRTLIGLAAAAIPLLAIFAVLGILDDFLRGTFIEVLGAGPAYTQGFFVAPMALQARRFFPEALSLVLDAQVFEYLFWPMLAVFAGVTIARKWPRRFEPLVLISVWGVLAGISYAERYHLYFGVIAALFIVAWIAWKRWLLLAAAAIVLANPTTHLAVLGTNRVTRAPSAEWVEVNDVPRARGAFWHTRDAAAIHSVQKYLALSMKPDETFLDFANSGILYYLFRRDCPIRQYEVAFFQSEEQQREVIRILETNPKIRAVLVTRTPAGKNIVDVPNAWRAPLVQQYIDTHFEPDFEEGEIAFRRRK